jgi:hypothetical protein
MYAFTQYIIINSTGKKLMCPIQFKSPWYDLTILTVMCTLKEGRKPMTIKHFLFFRPSRYKMYLTDVSTPGLQYMLHSDTLQLVYHNQCHGCIKLSTNTHPSE